MAALVEAGSRSIQRGVLLDAQECVGVPAPQSRGTVEGTLEDSGLECSVDFVNKTPMTHVVDVGSGSTKPVKLKK
jgi:hypothetical protein